MVILENLATDHECLDVGLGGLVLFHRRLPGLYEAESRNQFAQDFVTVKHKAYAFVAERLSNVDGLSRSKTTRGGRPTMRPAPRRKRPRRQAVSLRGGQQGGDAPAGIAAVVPDFAADDVRGALVAKVAGDRGGAVGLGRFLAADDFQVQPALCARTPSIASSKSASGPVSPSATSEARLGAWPIRQAAESSTVPSSISRRRLSFRVVPELVRSTMTSAIPRLGCSSRAPSESINW